LFCPKSPKTAFFCSRGKPFKAKTMLSFHPNITLPKYCGSLTVTARKTLASPTPISCNIRVNPIFANLQQATMQIGKRDPGIRPNVISPRKAGFCLLLAIKAQKWCFSALGGTLSVTNPLVTDFFIGPRIVSHKKICSH